jgi:quercetin dioxygenase-like cupin family protein
MPADSADLVVSAEEIVRRTIRRSDLRPDRAAFLDTRIPGSERKINYPLIGPGVSENEEQIVPLDEPHGFNLGGAVMPAGVVNNLHLHFTAEVFMCLGGRWQFRWGVDGTDGEAEVADGDVISIPTWVFRGFTSKTDDAWLYTALGRDVSGGLIWAPSVIEKAAQYGSFLSADSRLIQLEPGQRPQGVDLIEPLTADQLATLRRVSVEEMRQRLAKPADLEWCDEPFLDSRLPGGGAQLALVVGYGLTQNRHQRPRLADPHGLALAWLRAGPGQGVGLHRIAESEVLIVKSGRLKVSLNRDAPLSVELGPFDTFSVPRGAWRSFEAVGDEPMQAVVLTEGDGRVYPEWDEAVIQQALTKDAVIDPNGYVAPASLLPGFRS